MTRPDPMAANDETRAALSDPTYVAAFEHLAHGRSDQLTDDHRAAITKARELTNTDGPGLPLPLTEGTYR